MVSLKKIAKQKISLQSEGMYTMSMYIMTDGKIKFLLHCYTNIKRSDAPIWLDVSDEWN